jgi:phosphoglycolate phosphatase-like HAD superfamily hydrolase
MTAPHLIFDLDGTLSDPAVGILRSLLPNVSQEHILALVGKFREPQQHAALSSR